MSYQPTILMLFGTQVLAHRFCGLVPRSLAFHWVSIWWEHHNIIFLVCNQIAVQRFLLEERKICRTCEELRFRIEQDFQRVLIFWLVVWNMFYSPIYWDITQRWNPSSPSMVICSRKITPRFFRSLPQGHLSTGTSQRCILGAGRTIATSLLRTRKKPYGAHGWELELINHQ